LNNGSIGLSVFLITVGATRGWAISGSVSGVDIQVVDVILFVVGSAGLAVSLLFSAPFAPFADRAPLRRRVVRELAPPPSKWSSGNPRP
jgi:hypothetical protein